MDKTYEKLDKIESKFERQLDRLDGKIHNIEKELVVYNEQLKHHIEGVRQARIENNMLREYIDLETEKIQGDIAPIKRHVEKMQNSVDILKNISGIILKFWGLVSIVVGILYSLGTLFKWF